MCRNKFTIILILCTITVACHSKIPQEDDIYDEQEEAVLSINVFESNINGYSSYRIPAIIRDKHNNLYVFSEGRSSDSDFGKIDLVMRISNDGGYTWNSQKVLLSDGENKFGNPAPIYDEINDRIILLTKWSIAGKIESDYIKGGNHNGIKLYMTYSDDCGENWSTLHDITSCIPDSLDWFTIGNVHGIQLRQEDNKGRLIVTGDHTINNKYYSHIIYSDDGGYNWRMGGMVSRSGTNECTVAELSDGTLILNIRNQVGVDKYQRLQAYSFDAGESWSSAETSSLIEPVCEGCIINYSRNETYTDTLLFSNPASLSRDNMTIHQSTDNGVTWHKKYLVWERYSAYSDMASLNDGFFCIIFEYGSKYRSSIKLIKYKI